MTLDREDLRAAQRGRGACLICWPALVSVHGQDGAAIRLTAWDKRVEAIKEALANPQPKETPDAGP